MKLNCYPILNKDKICTHIVITAHDIAEKVKLEEHIFKIDKLESIGLFAGGIAHDLNNFLTVMMGNISLAMTKIKIFDLDNEAKDKILNLLNEAEVASHQAKNLTQQLLTFAKGGEPIMKASSIEKLLREAAGFALRGSNILCEFYIAENLWAVEIDEGQITQVINNLIINANQAMPGGGKIKICADNMKIDYAHALPVSDGKYVEVSIKDTGIGMPKEILNVFLGYEVSCAKVGVEAIEMYIKAKESKNAFDLVLLDLTIPGGLGGKETIEELVKLDADIKAIVSSGYSNDAVLANFKEYGFKDIITKPYRIEEVGEVIHNALIR